jgi:hypothetical protein
VKRRSHLAFVVSVDGTDHTQLIALYDGEMDVVWGPGGSGFAVIRCKAQDGPYFMALDLKRAEWLRASK